MSTTYSMAPIEFRHLTSNQIEPTISNWNSLPQDLADQRITQGKHLQGVRSTNLDYKIEHNDEPINNTPKIALAETPPDWPHHRAYLRDRPTVKPSELCPGLILWHPHKSELNRGITCVRDCHCDGKQLDDNGYNHPVVVLEVNQAKGSTEIGDVVCKVASLRSFNKTSPAVWQNKKQVARQFDESIPIFQKEGDFDSLVDLLYLATGRMATNSYVQLQHLWEIPYQNLQRYKFAAPISSYRFSGESYARLVRLLGLKGQEYHQFSMVKSTAYSRLEKLSHTSDDQRKDDSRRLNTTLNPAAAVFFPMGRN